MTTETKAITETEALFRDLNKPSLHALSYALRHPDTWPKGFVWDYQHCNKCAMGLANVLWKLSFPKDMGQPNTGSSVMAKIMHIGFKEAQDIFFDANLKRQFIKEEIIKTGVFGWGRPIIRKVKVAPERELITPEMVADDIDAYLKRIE